MALLPASIDYTDKDFDSLRLRLYALVRSVFPEWTDENTANFGNLLIELYAHVGDVLAVYLDNLARESRITTASQRRALIGLTKLVGFRPATAAPASADVVLSIPAPVAGDVNFAAGDQFSTGEVVEAVTFQVLTPAVILAGQTSVTTTVEHSENAQDVVTSSGLAGQEFVLVQRGYLDGSASVTFADGAYTEVTALVNSGPTDKHYVVAVDQNDVAHLRFGNGTNGKVPVGAGTVNYKIGGGAIGNVDPGTITRPASSYTDTFATAVVVSCTNPARASGGMDRMSNARIRDLAPESIRAPVNCVSRDDFVVNARKIAGVARALMLTSNEDPAVPENTGVLYIVPQGGGEPSNGLKAAVLTQVTVTYPCTLTFKVSVDGPRYKPVDVRATVYRRQGYSGAAVRAAIVATLTSFFAVTNPDGSDNPNVGFGADVVDASGATNPGVAWSDVFNAIRDVTGVRKVAAGPGGGLLLNLLAADVPLDSQEFPQLGTVTLYDGDTGALLG